MFVLACYSLSTIFFVTEVLVHPVYIYIYALTVYTIFQVCISFDYLTSPIVELITMGLTIQISVYQRSIGGARDCRPDR